MFGDLSFNNNLIYVNSNSYMNGLYNTLSSYIRTTNNNLNNYESYIYLYANTLSRNLYNKCATQSLLTNTLLAYSTFQYVQH